MSKKIVTLFGCLLFLFATAGSLFSTETKDVAESVKDQEATPATPTPAIASESWEGKVVVLPLHGVIAPEKMGGKMESFIRAVKDADKAKLIIVEINSPGGVVDSCDKICETLLHSPVPVKALVIRQAVSGGAMVATACKEIYMVKGSRIGDIQPMMMVPGAKIDERTAEKVEADVRAIMASNARQNGYSKELLEAMVSRSFQVYEVKFKDGTREFLKKQAYELLRKNMTEGLDKREFAEPPRVVVEGGKLLSLEANDAKFYGIATEVVSNAETFYKSLDVPKNQIVRAEIGEGELDLAKALTPDINLDNWVLLLLIISLVAGVAGSLAEMHMPGFGIPGAIGIIGFTTFFTLLFMHGRAEPYEIAIFVAGIALLVVEIVVLPGFGVAGIAGLFLLVTGLGLAMLPDFDNPQMQANFWGEITFSSLTTLGVLVAAAVIFIIIMERGDKIPGLKRIVFSTTLPGGREVLEQAKAIDADDTYNPDERTKYLKKKGVCITPLRPSGKVKLAHGEILDVVSRGELIENGTKVIVAAVEMNHIVVEREEV